MGQGMIGKALAGAAAVAVPFAMESYKSEIQAERDARLNEYATQSQQRGFTQQTNERVAGQEFTSGEHAADRTFRTGERVAGETFTAGENKATRTHQENLQTKSLEHAAKLHRESIGVQLAGQKIHERQVVVMEQGAALDRQIKTIQVNNAQQVETLRTQFQAETDPTKRSQISENISILTGKDSDKFLPVPLKDDQGNITGYEIFDTKNGRFVDNSRAPGAAGTGAKWDSGSGKVWLDGKQIGTAKSEGEARTLIGNARKPAGGGAAPGARGAGAPAAPSSALVDTPPGTIDAASDEEVAATEAAGPGRARVGGRGAGIIDREINKRTTVY